MKNNVRFIRGGRISLGHHHTDFQGLGLDGMKILDDIRRKYNLLAVSEILDPRDIEIGVKYTDIIQIGSRNMQNYSLLKEIGKINHPILLKRGMMATINEFLFAAEYIASNGNENIIMCERGIRTFETYTRNTLDLQAIPVIKKLTHLPIIIDPSHAGGKWWLVEPMAKASIAAGCDGLMIEVHNNPEKALCDGPQSLRPEKYEELLKQINKIADVVGKKV